MVPRVFSETHLSSMNGCDPASQLLRFAKELRGSTLHLDMISLGRGQGPKAEELISKAQILKGRWVFLQNCHLAASWMPRLQAIVEKFSRPNDDVDPQFRLWLSSKPDPTFPISILQTGMKMTVESPQGLKANMLKSFGSGGTGVVTEKVYEEGSSNPAWPKLLFGLCLFNSVIHERKKYSTLGWNIPYEFNDSDLEVSILKLQMLLEEADSIPWEALLYLTGEVTFGGRVTDDWDRRCLLSTLKKFYRVEALSDDYSYSDNGVYHPIPDKSSLTDLHSFVEAFPNYDSSEMFGMTENAEKLCREQQANDLVSTMVSVQPRIYAGYTGTQKSSDEIVLELASDIMERLPKAVEELDDDYVAPSGGSSTKLPKLSLQSLLKGVGEAKVKETEKMTALETATHDVIGNSALITVLRQEIDRFNNLLSGIHTSLAALILAVKGEIIMSDALEDAYKALLTQSVPQQWKNSAYESRKPLGSWVIDLILRVDFFSQWAETITISVGKKFKIMTQNRSQAQTELDTEETFPMQPRSFWLSGFFFPQGFLTAVQQNHARKLGISVDSLLFEYKVLPGAVDEDDPSKHHHTLNIKQAAFTGNTPPDDGVLIFGLFLDGARWDSLTHSLQDLQENQRFSQLPEMHFLPVQMPKTPSGRAQTQSSSDQNVVKSYDCPLYRTSTRAGTLSSTGHSTNFVSSIDLPSLQEPDFWVLRGVAMLCQLDD